MTRKRGGQKGPRGDYEEPLFLDMDPDEALERLSGVSNEEAEAVEMLVKDDSTIDGLMKAFEDAAHDDGDAEFWRARDLARLFGYADYRNFQSILEKAKIACSNSGQSVENHFVDVTDMVQIGSTAVREVSDVLLSRYGAYLAAQNADPRKQAVAFAQTYFATQTRRAELADKAPVVSYDEKRVLLRGKLKEHNKSLAEAAKTAGVTNFANFNGAGLKGLYGGMNKAQVVKAKGLPAGGDHLDYAGHAELAANYFKATQAEERLRREGVSGQRAAETAHKEVGAAVRQTIIDLGNTPPEKMASEDHIKEAQKRVKAAQPQAIAAPKTPRKPKKN